MSDFRSTVREALEAEMLADIGRLHDTVQELKRDIPEMLNGIRLLHSGAHSMEPEQMTAQALQQLIRREVQSIHAAGQEAKRIAHDALLEATRRAVAEGWITAEKRGEQIYEQAAEQFATKISASARQAEERAIATLKGICIEVNKERARDLKTQWLAMISVGIGTGLLTGLATTFAAR